MENKVFKDIWCVEGIMVDDQWCEGCFTSYDDAVKQLDEIEKRNKNNMVTRSKEDELYIEGIDVTFYVEKTKLFQ